MLKGLVAWVLNSYFDEFLENLNTDQLSIALLQGQVELENVPLKKTALKKFDVPVQVKSGFLGKLTLSVPLADVLGAPWIVKITDLLVLLGPSSYSDVAEEKEEESATPERSWWFDFFTQSVSAIVNNIQLIAHNVHIRYEDVSLPFNCGIRIRCATATTTNAQWKAEFVQPKEGANVFKILDLQGLSLYWNSRQEIHKTITSYEDLQKILSPEDARNNVVLQPFNSTLRIETNWSELPLTDPSSPRFKIDFLPEQRVVIEVSQSQLADIRFTWARFDRGRQHKEASSLYQHDALLAEIVFHSERMTIRFIDSDEENAFGCTRVLALDLWSVVGRLQLSPSTTVTLSVGDMSIQLLETERRREDASGSDGDSLDEDELFQVNETATLLLAIGKSSEDSPESQAHSSPRTKPLFQMVYRQDASSLVARHTLEASFSSISVVYDEDALEGLTALFDTETPQPSEQQIQFTMNIAELQVELRTRQLSFLGKNEHGAALLNFKIADLRLDVAQTEQIIAQVCLTGSRASLSHTNDSYNVTMTLEMENLDVDMKYETSKAPIDNEVSLTMRSSQMSMWLVDDYKGRSLPLVRFIISSLSFDYGSSAWNSSLNIAMDYFNQQLFEWEPFLEEWVIQKFAGSIKESTASLDLETRQSSTLDFNLTQSLMHQFLHYSSRWDDIRRKARIIENPAEMRSFTEGLNLEINVVMPSGIGFSLINGSGEELLYARLHGVFLHATIFKNTYRLTSSVNVIQIDNQLTTSDKWQFVFCHMNALNDEVDSPAHEENKERIDEWSDCARVPALKIEMSCTPDRHYDAFECFRVKLCDTCVQLDEMLLWKLVEFIQESGAADSFQPDSLLQPPNMDLERPDPLKARKCYFGTLDLEMGCAALSVVTVASSGLSPELRALKQQFNVKLVSFENAWITMPPFRQLHYFETFSFLGETLRKFYMAELQKQTVNIVITMDAFGNPLGLATDIKESFQCLFLEGDLGGFVSGVGYGVTNSLSKVASSVAHGVGSITFDKKHKLMRQRMLKPASQQVQNTALSHLYVGVKGLGVGLLGGFTAIVNNTVSGTKKSGFTGALKGATTGVVDTVTKPVQGIFDFVEGTASAMKEMIGSPSRKLLFVEERIRPPRQPKDREAKLISRHKSTENHVYFKFS